MQKEYVIQFYKTINKLLCDLSFAGQYSNYYTYLSQIDQSDTPFFIHCRSAVVLSIWRLELIRADPSGFPRPGVDWWD